MSKNPNPNPRPWDTLLLELETIQYTQTRSDNLTKNERLALTNLAKRTDIVINKADKGSTIVVQDREQYVQDGLSHLANETVYKPLTEDITPWIKAEILSKLESLYRTGMIDKRNARILRAPQGT